jgi:hypothetical protein
MYYIIISYFVDHQDIDVDEPIVVVPWAPIWIEDLALESVHPKLATLLRQAAPGHLQQKPLRVWAETTT